MKIRVNFCISELDKTWTSLRRKPWRVFTSALATASGWLAGRALGDEGEEGDGMGRRGGEGSIVTGPSLLQAFTTRRTFPPHLTPPPAPPQVS